MIRDHGGSPIAGAFVGADSLTCCGGSSATTAADGTYTITALAPGSYRVRASAAGLPQRYYNNTYDVNTAQVVSASDGTTTSGIDITLEPGGSISGVIRDHDGSPIAGARVEADDTACCGTGSATSAVDGTYTISGLAPGAYRVEASAAGLPGRYYNNTYDINVAQLVDAATGVTTTGIDITLEPGGSISGVIRDSIGNPIAGANVQAQGAVVCCPYGSATTAADGTYTITGLSAGSYHVNASAPTFASRYYDGTYDASAAAAVIVTAGGTTPAIDISLEPAGSISGTVRDSQGNPLAGASLFASADTCCAGAFATSAADGSYTLTGLPPGSFRVQASAFGYVGVYYDNADFGGATLVAVTSGNTTSNIDFALQRGGSITGVVKDDIGNPIANASIFASGDTCCGEGFGTSAADGSYTIVGLPAGSYTVRATATTYLGQYFDGAQDESGATPVS
ncbi:MAG TPA: carboxypeptidase-like regulatory domain-containing protein, partial [Thermomicrobiales bacterium]|nr:carboxypeptidase-like regulatory domain-containing protein [Thermomicrobiales bacterium]